MCVANLKIFHVTCEASAVEFHEAKFKYLFLFVEFQADLTLRLVLTFGLDLFTETADLTLPPGNFVRQQLLPAMVIYF